MAQPLRVSARPAVFPAPEFPPRKPRLFARTPPAVFPVLLGLLGVGLALRKGLAALALPGGAAELFLGAVGAIWLFSVVAYGGKLIRRPSVIAEDMRVLPGRGGVAALSQSAMAMATTLAPIAPRLGGGLLIVALAVHGVQAVVLVRVLDRLPPLARQVNPTLHLSFVGPIVGAVAAAALGWTELAAGIFWAILPVATLIWVLSALQFSKEVPPAPLRPMLAIHLAPASLLTTVAAQTGHAWLAIGLGVLAVAYLAVLLGNLRWLLVSGFTPIWASLTFPVGAFTLAMFALGWVWPGLIALMVCLGLVPWIAGKIFRMWATGDLAQRTNAAEA